MTTYEDLISFAAQRAAACEVANEVPHDVLVSVYMVTYNHSPYIRQAIESVLAQETTFRWELCIGEDRSTDGTRDICREFAERHPDKIRLFLRTETDKQSGRAYSPGRWNGFLTRVACRGRYIAILEGDDFWIDPCKLQRQVEVLLKHKEVSVCATRVLVWQSGDNVGTHINPGEYLAGFGLDALVEGNGGIVNTCSLLYRRPNRDPFWWSSDIQSGDWALLVDLLAGGMLCCVLPSVSAVYRVHGTGVTAQYRGAGAKVKICQSYVNNLEALLKRADCKDILGQLEPSVMASLAYFRAAVRYHLASGFARCGILAMMVCRHPAIVWRIARSTLIQAVARGWRGIMRLLPATISNRIELLSTRAKS
jgi:glycosyltransferase involved in cell wall biosynthesis